MKKKNSLGEEFLPKRAAILIRVSSDEQVKGTSLDTQLEDCKKKTKDEDYFTTEDDIFREEGVSGALPIERRPKLKALFDRMEQGNYGALICYSPDRLSREAIDQLIYEREADSYGCRVIYVTETYDDSPEGQLMRTVRAGFAQYERALTRRRTMRGRMKALSSGQFAGGRIPYGYIWTKEDGWRIEEAQASIVQQIFDWYVNRGLTIRDIATKLNEMRVPCARSGSYWRTSAVRRILCHPGYVGIQYALRGKVDYTFRFHSLVSLKAHADKAVWIPVPNFPPILTTSEGSPDLELWEAAQRRRASNRKGGTGYRTRNWPLQGRIMCGECNRQLRCRHNHSGTGKRVYYCHTGRDTVGIVIPLCTTPRLIADEIERAVASVLTYAFSYPQHIEIAVQKYLDEMQVRRNGLLAVTRPIQGDVENQRKKLNRARKLYIDGKINEKEYEELAQPLVDKIESLEAAASGHELALAQIDKIEADIHRIKKALEDGTLTARVSRLKGLEILRLRSEAEQSELVRQNGQQFHGVEGIDKLVHECLPGKTEFIELLNLLKITVVADSRGVRLEGVIPLDVVLDEYLEDSYSRKPGSSKVRSSFTIYPYPVRYPVPYPIPYYPSYPSTGLVRA